MALTSQLQKHWDDLSNMIVDSDQEKQQLKPGTFKPKQCHDLGICVCGSGPASSPDALLFHTRLVLMMKHFMMVKDRRDPKSELRILLESRLLVFRLVMTPSRGDAMTITEDDSSLYFLIGHINLTTWHYSLLQLHFKCHTAHEVVLQVMHPEGGDRTLCVRTSLQFFAEKVNLERKWGIQFCRVIHNDNQLPKFEMTPDIVEIEAFPSLHPFWRGRGIEREESNKNSHRSQRKKPEHSRGRGRGRPSRPNPLPVQRGRQAAFRAAALADIGDIGENPQVPDQDVPFADDGDFDGLVDALAASGSDEEDSGTDHERDEDSDSVQTESVNSAFGVNDLKDLEDMAELSAGHANAAVARSSGEVAVASDEAVVEPAMDAQPSKRPRVELARPRAEAESTEKISVEQYGEIRFNVNGYMRAVCFQHEPIGSCVRQRTCRSAIPGRGRPIGQLTAWLFSASEHETSKAHIKAGVASLQDRSDAREMFYTLPGGEFFAEQFEAEKAHGEADEPKQAR